MTSRHCGRNTTLPVDPAGMAAQVGTSGPLAGLKCPVATAEDVEGVVLGALPASSLVVETWPICISIAPAALAVPLVASLVAAPASLMAALAASLIARRCYTHCAEPMLPCRHSCTRVKRSSSTSSSAGSASSSSSLRRHT